MRTLELKRGGTLKLEGGAGTELGVITGGVWLTQHHDTKDYVIAPGQRLVLNGLGTTLIYAFHDSTLRLSTPQEARNEIEVDVRGLVSAAA